MIGPTPAIGLRGGRVARPGLQRPPEAVEPEPAEEVESGADPPPVEPEVPAESALELPLLPPASPEPLSPEPAEEVLAEEEPPPDEPEELRESFL